MTKVMQCEMCGGTPKQQDAIHGPGKRVHNLCKNGTDDKQRKWRCTGCGNEKSIAR